MRHLPIFLDLRDRRVTVVGTTGQAVQRAKLALRAGARVERLSWPITPESVAGTALLLVATGNDKSDFAAAQMGRRANVPVNVVDRPELCDFIMPAIVDRDPVIVAIGTGGASPTIARKVREWIEAMLPSRIGILAQFIQRFRGSLGAAITDGPARRRFWEQFLDGPVAEQILAGRDSGALQAMIAMVNRPSPIRGSVHLVGAGPGDPDLLTLMALRALQRADVILHDELVPAAVLDRARRDARLVNVGKRKGSASYRQEEIHALMAAEARAGRMVVRLKAGDPFLFGRGGEEQDYLRMCGIDVFVVPGISAAFGCAAAIGVPLTHREHASSVTFVTGHSRDGGPEPDWQALARASGTIVIYMGLANATEIRRRLLAAGLPSSTPVAIIERGTQPDQRVSKGDLSDLTSLAAAHDSGGPALIVIGAVAGLESPDACQLAEAS